MNSSDKNAILIIAIFVIFILIALGIFAASSFVNPLWLGILWLLVDQFYYKPVVYDLFMKMIGQDSYKADPFRFIPVYNEVIIFPKVLGLINLIISIVLMVFVFVAVLPVLGIDWVTVAVATMFGDSVGMNYLFYLILITVPLYLALSVVKGLGYIDVKRRIDNFEIEAWGLVKYYKKVNSLLLFVPFLRSIGLAQIAGSLTRIVEFNNYKTEVNFVERGIDK